MDAYDVGERVAARGGASLYYCALILLLLRRRSGAIDILTEIHRHDYQALEDDGRT